MPKSSDIRHCPSCQGELESGLLRTESFIGGAKWIGKAGKENIKSPGWSGYVKIKGLRCKNCRILILGY